MGANLRHGEAAKPCDQHNVTPCPTRSCVFWPSTPPARAAVRYEVFGAPDESGRIPLLVVVEHSTGRHIPLISMPPGSWTLAEIVEANPGATLSNGALVPPPIVIPAGARLSVPERDG